MRRSENGRCAERKEGSGASVYPPLHGESRRRRGALLMACAGLAGADEQKWKK